MSDVTLMLRDLPEDQRPRERLLARGAQSLHEAELIAILLRVGTRGRSAVTLAHELLQRFHGLAGLVQATCNDIATVPGLGMAKATQLKAAFEIAARYAVQQVQDDPLDDPRRVYAFLAPQMRHLSQESVRVVLLDTRLRCKGVEELSRGTTDQALVSVKEVFAPAISRRAYGIIIAHNHPAGDPSPSEADIRVTASLASAARLLEVRLLDHMIIGRPCPAAPDGWFSFRSAGHL